jgi:hypothetical protein
METLTSFYYQAEDFARENPWIVLVVLLAFFWFVVKPRLSRFLCEGFTGGQSAMGRDNRVAQDEYATSN